MSDALPHESAIVLTREARAEIVALIDNKLTALQQVDREDAKIAAVLCEAKRRLQPPTYSREMARTVRE